MTTPNFKLSEQEQRAFVLSIEQFGVDDAIKTFGALPVIASFEDFIDKKTGLRDYVLEASVRSFLKKQGGILLVDPPEKNFLSNFPSLRELLTEGQFKVPSLELSQVPEKIYHRNSQQVPSIANDNELPHDVLSFPKSRTDLEGQLSSQDPMPSLIQSSPRAQIISPTRIEDRILSYNRSHTDAYRILAHQLRVHYQSLSARNDNTPLGAALRGGGFSYQRGRSSSFYYRR